MTKITFQCRSIKRLIGLLITLSLLACNEPSPGDSNKQHLVVEVNAKEATSAEESFPYEVNQISIKVINDQEEVASSSVLGNSASFNLSVPGDTPLAITAYAYSGKELLYQGSNTLVSLTGNDQTTIEITLDSQVTVSVPTGSQTVTDSEVIELSRLVNVQGLNDTGLSYAVNDIEGGNKTFGLVSTSGTYTPPHLPETRRVQLSATPIAAPPSQRLLRSSLNPRPLI